MKFKRGVQGYASILAALQSPKTTQELAAIGHREDSIAHLSRVLRMMTRAGLVHTSGWQAEGHKGPARRILKAGQGVDAPYPTGRRSVNHRNGERRPPVFGGPIACGVEMLAFAEIVKALDLGATTEEMGIASGMVKHSLLRLMKHMRRLRLVHIHGWAVNAPIWKTGARVDQKRPKPQSQAANRARYEARMKEARKFLPLDSVLRIAA